jgi:hypothetical protein
MEEGGIHFGEVSPESPPRTVSDAVYIAVKTQRAGSWNLSVAATGDFRAGEGGPTFPIGSLELAARLNGQPAPFQKCATAPVTLVTDGPVNGGIVAMDYRLSVGYDAPALAGEAEYRSDLVYTTSFGTLATSYVDPNPFDPDVHQVATVRYYYSRVSYPYVTVQVFDSTGRVVLTRSFPRPPDGWYEETWDGRDMAGVPVPDGVYSYSITSSLYIIAGGYINVRRGARSPQRPTGEAGPRYDLGTMLQLSVSSHPQSATVGDIVTVSARLRNAGTSELAHSRVEFELPQGVRSVNETCAFDDGKGGRTATVPLTIPTTTGVSWDLGAIPGGDSVNFSFKAIVGPDALSGDRVLRARASAALGKFILRSEEAVVRLGIDAAAESARGAVVGRVFIDRDRDGRMTRTDEPAQGVLVWAGGAKSTRSDAGGLVVLGGLSPGNHVLRVDERTLPPGWEPRTTMIVVSIAPGETVRLDIPLQPSDQSEADAATASPSWVLAGAESVTLEMGLQYTSLHAEGSVAARAKTGLELSLSSEGRMSWAATSSEMMDRLVAPQQESAFSGLATLVTPIARHVRFTAGLSLASGASSGLPALRVGMDATPVRGLTLGASYDTTQGLPQLSGVWEAPIADGLTIATGVDIAKSGEAILVHPTVSATLAMQSGVAGRLSLRGASHPAAEFAFSLPLGGGLSLSLTHRRHIGTSATQGGPTDSAAESTLQVRYLASGKARLSMVGQYDTANRRFTGSMLVGGDALGGGSWHADLDASFEPSASSVSMQAGIALPGRLEPVARLTCQSEVSRPEHLHTKRKLSLSLSCSVALDQATSASGTFSLKRIDDHSPPVPASTVTQSAAAHLERRVAPGLSLGAGVSWTHLRPGDLSVAALEARAACDISPHARLVLGYRVPLAGSHPAAVGGLWQPGPYLTLLLVSGWDRAVPGLPGEH